MQLFKRPIALLALALLGLAALAWIFAFNGRGGPVEINGTAVPPLPGLEAALIDRGEAVYAQNCASCHGLNLEGAADWRKPLEDGSLPAPPHDTTGHTWHHPDFQLQEIIAKGGVLYNGTMPGFAGQLSEQEVEAVLAFIKSHWGSEERAYQWWITNTYPTPTPTPR